MVKRCLVLIAANVLAFAQKEYGGMNWKEIFTIVTSIGFLIISLWTYGHAVIKFKPDKDKLRQFVNMIGSIAFGYILVACICYGGSKLVQRSFWDFSFIGSVLLILLGDIKIRFERNTTHNEYIEETIDSCCTGITQSNTIRPGEAVSGGVRFNPEENSPGFFGPTVKMDLEAFRKAAEEAQANSPNGEADWAEIFAQMFEDSNKK